MLVATGFSFQLLTPMDNAINNLIKGWHTPWLDKFFQFVTSLADPMAFYIIAPLAVLVLLWRKKQIEAIFITACLLTSWGVMNLLKLIFVRPRPIGPALTVAAGYSFPSGHALVSMAFYGFTAYLLLKSWNNIRGRMMAFMIGILVLLVGISRVYLNVHYASDVIAGYIIGAVILGGFIWGFKGVKE